MGRLNARLKKLENLARASSPNDDEAVWRVVMSRLSDDELRSLRAALKRCIGEYGYLPEDAPILERAQQLRDEVVSERCNP